MRRSVLEWLIWQLEHEVDDQHFKMQCWLFSNVRDEGIIYKTEQSIPHCKTAGCIAGTLFLRLPKAVRKAWAKWYKPDDHPTSHMLPDLVAQSQLDISDHVASALFQPTCELSLVKREHAIAVLKNILLKGKLDWKKVLPLEQHIFLNWTTRQPLKIKLTDD